ncbi:MAG TPA: dephospho-CoA kinase [Syntrophobacteraceae bacterium]|nr:dephospho-CoA kinase [Syntrophobacteraceae bacterium]
MSEKRKVALTGGIATGKSTVAAMFARRGALLLDADQAAREVVSPGTPCWSRLRSLLDPVYFGARGNLERRALRERIIRDPVCRQEVSSILHPAIMEWMETRWAEALESRPGRPVVFDIPLLFEADLHSRFDVIILVYVPAAVQVERLMARDGVSLEEARETLAMQLPIESKRARAHFLIDNSRDPEHTRHQADTVFEAVFPDFSRQGPPPSSPSPASL